MNGKRALLIAGVTLTCILIAAIVACGNGEAAEVKVNLMEWSVTPNVTQLKAGQVRFVVTNDGKRPHEFVVIKSDLSVDSLPVVEGKVDEERVEIVDEIEPFGAGETQRKTVNLKAGKYILICNIVERVPGQPVESHYQQGMRTAFVVNH